MAGLLVSLHQFGKSRTPAPICFVGAGVPLLTVRLVKARTYAEHIFRRYQLEPLTTSEVFEALREPARGRGRDFAEAALARIDQETDGYPFFVQIWGNVVWKQTEEPLITLVDVEAAKPRVTELLDQTFFRLRGESLTAAEC